MPRQRSKDKPRLPEFNRTVSYYQWERWKREAAKPEYAIPAFAIIRSVGKVSRERYLESMLEFEEKYPGRGWKEQAKELENWYLKTSERLNIDFAAFLKEIPAGYGLLACTEPLMRI